MNNFKIFFRATTSIEINGRKQTFTKGKFVGFKNVNKKDMDAIRKLAIKSKDFIFTMTDDTLGCFKIVYGNAEVGKDNKKQDLITMNKGKKNKDGKVKPVAVPEPVKEEVVEQVEEIKEEQIDQELLTGLESNDIIEEEEVVSDEQAK